ncbi:Zn(2)-C6 fungal-type domain-containing protein [Pseudozyma hubeiensis]|nr:Zn(2)-C6 fungal-type domain-containing protein [Pseudozyma hubeiensis]
MSPPETKSSPHETGRIRSSRACKHCSRRKVKCDGTQPCSKCLKESIVCEYGAQNKRGPPKGCDPRGGRKKKVQHLSSDAPLSSSATPMPSRSSPASNGLGSTLSAIESRRRTIKKERPPEPHVQPHAQAPGSSTSSTTRYAARDRTPSTFYHAPHDAPMTRPRSPPHVQSHLQPSIPPDRQHAGHAWLPSASGARNSHSQPSSAPYQYDAYPLQRPVRDHHRTSPRASHHSMPPTHASAIESGSQLMQDRTAPGSPLARSTVSVPSQAYPTSRLHSNGLHYEAPTNHHPPAPSLYDRLSTLPSSSTLSSRHPVSASRFAEPSLVTPPSTAHIASSVRNPVFESSDAFTSTTNDRSPSSTGVPHRSWYNSSRPSSPRGPLSSISRSQVSSPGSLWLDHQNRPGSGAADRLQPSSSYRVHLEDRLPPHITQRLLDIYQTFVHPHWPIIYLPSFASLHSLKQSRPILFEAMLAVASNTFDAYHDSASHGDQQSSNPVLEMLYADSPQSSEQAYNANELRDHLVHRVKTRILEGKFTQDIGTIQAAILIAVIELGCGDTSSAFHFGGIACRMALDMNLHRCTTQPPSSASHASHHAKSGDGRDQSPQSSAQVQERLRVFWACYIVDKILSTALDKPAQLRSAEIEADWPSVQEADEYDVWLNETTRKFVDKAQLPYLEGVKVHALSSFKAWAEVMSILERILEQVYSPQAKRDRRRTGGTSDCQALLALNERLNKWRANLPEHLKWSGTWLSSELLSSGLDPRPSADRKEGEAHRGLPPQILTMRSWYCICLILLHRPRVPRLKDSTQSQRARCASDEPASIAVDDEKITSAAKTKGRSSLAAEDEVPEPAGLDICNAAAKEVCDILHVYGSSFRIRKISSSWVYIIFQAATIHAALAASKSVVVFKARQSSVWNRRDSKTLDDAMSPPVRGDNVDARAGVGDPESHHVTETELEGSSELVKTSARYLAQCVRYLKRIGPTWQSASHHVAVLRNLCIASAQARRSPSSPATAQHFISNSDVHRTPSSPSLAGFKLEHRGNGLADTRSHIYHARHDSGFSSTLNGEAHAQHQRVRSTHPDNQQVYHDHTPVNGAMSLNGTFSTNTPDFNVADPHPIQPHQAPFVSDPAYAATSDHGQLLSSQQQQQQQQQQMMQQAMHMINADDSTFWASMPVASEGFNEWDEFFKTFNPGSVTGFSGQSADYHPTAAVDLITALQDPNRLLGGVQQQ